MFLQDVNLVLSGSNINNNFALISGGFSYLACSIDNSNQCSYDINSNMFGNNSANKSGGAVFYDLYSPINFDTNMFENNSAPYGPNFASYAYKLLMTNEELGWA